MEDRFGSAGEVRWIGPAEGRLGEAHACLSLRSGGVSQPPFDTLNLGHSAGDDLVHVDANERIWMAARDLPGPPARLKLAHGTEAIRVDRPGTYAPYDAILTGRRGLPLWLTVADCFPVFLAAGEWIALVHCGWRGTAEGAARVTARALAEASGSPASELRVWIGPGVGACCYPVGEEVASQFSGGRARAVAGRWHLDLGGAITDDLLGAGLDAERIDRSPLCTSCNPDLFYSYRRDGARSGRMAAVIWR